MTLTFDTMIALYVADAAASARFYETLLERAPIEASPTFALFALGPATKLGLWGVDSVRPAAAGVPGAFEIALSVETPELVDATRAAWGEKNVAILLEPIDLEFGRSFVAADPDGHRLRVYCVA